MPVVDNSIRENRVVSFAPNLIDSREEPPLQQQQQQQQEQEQIHEEFEIRSVDDSIIDDGTGKRFTIAFQEHRLRFDQKFPEGLDLRIPESEYEIILEQIHREFIKPVDNKRKSVRKWSALVAGTAPIGIGFVLSIFLARRVNRQQKALRHFWISLRSHLKALNRDIYYARGIEWRIERDIEKISERDAYNKLLSFKMEIIFKKPVRLREVALHSVIQSNRATLNLRNSMGSSSISSRFSADHLTDPELFAVLATTPGVEEYSYPSMILEDDAAGVGSASGYINQRDLDINSSPYLISDSMTSNQEEDLILKVDEPADVIQARSISFFEPPSPTPTGSIFTKFDDEDETEGTGKRMTFADVLREEDKKLVGENIKVVVHDEPKKMTFAELLQSSIKEEGEEEEEEKKKVESLNEPEETGITFAAGAGAGAAGAMVLTGAVVAASSDRSPSPSHQSPKSREEAFAQRQRKKFSREPVSDGTQLYDIPESPKLGADDDPTGDAMTYLNESADEDLIEDVILGGKSVSIIPYGFKPKPVVNTHFEDVGQVPVAAYPMADPFTALYETDQVTPVDPPIECDEELEYTDVDGEVEYVRRKKWRVAPENVGKLSRAQTMSESIHPSSRRSSYLPVTKTTNMPSTINFNENEKGNLNK